METRPKILTPTFAILSVVTICFFLGGNMLIPVLPRYLESSGLLPYQLGIVIGAQSVSAIVARLLIGREIDRRGRTLFLSIGVAVGALASLAYPLVSHMPGLIAIRLFHGIAIASFYPAATALVADITHPSRRGEALSYFSMFLYAGFAIGPALGESLLARVHFTGAFLASAAVGGVGFIASRFLKEPQRETSSVAKLPFLHRGAAFPALVLGFVSFSFAGLGTFVPLYVSAEGNGDSRFFFIALSVTIIVLRSFIGRLADRFSPGALIIPGTILCGLALFTIAAGAQITVLVAGAILFGLGWGALFPGLMNYTIDRVRADERGSAMGTFTAAFDASFGLSQPLLGLILQVSSFHWLFMAGGLGAFVSAVTFVFGKPRSDAVFPALETGSP